MIVVWPTSTPGDVSNGIVGAGSAVEGDAEIAGAGLLRVGGEGYGEEG